MSLATEGFVEQLTNGLTYQQLANGIHKYVFTTVSRETVDRFADKMTETDREAHVAGRHTRSLFIMTNQPVTPYLVSSAIELSRNTPSDLRESMAVVGDNLVLTLVRHLIFRRTTSKTAQATRFFKTEADALEWLEARRLHLGD